MGQPERDHYTGHMTTGHEWNGIKELNTPVPRILIGFLGAAFLFAVGYWYFMPAWPLGDDYTRGKLGIDQRDEVRAELARAEDVKAEWTGRMAEGDFAAIRADEELMSIVRASGPGLYRDNCAMCHGRQGKGGLNFPNLTDDSWLWGNRPEDIARTLQVGINADHPETRVAQMPAFGQNGALTPDEIRGVVTYVRSIHDESVGSGVRADELLQANLGKRTYEKACVACHGVELEGNPALGAPNLADDYWIYGGDADSLLSTIQYGRGGHMPAWETRLSTAERNILALYVLSLAD